MFDITCLHWQEVSPRIVIADVVVRDAPARARVEIDPVRNVIVAVTVPDDQLHSLCPHPTVARMMAVGRPLDRPLDPPALADPELMLPLT